MDKISNVMKAAAQGAAEELIQRTPGASTALSVIQAAVNNRLEARARALFEAIALRMGKRDWAAATRELQENVGRPWFDEAIEAGFRTIIDSVDPASWRCIGFLVAEHVASGTGPDEAFRKVGSVLREADKQALVALRSMSRAYGALASAHGSGRRVLVYNLDRPGRVEPPLFWFAIMRDESSILSDRLARPASFEQCLRILVTARIGDRWEGLSSHTFEGNPALKFEPADDAAMALLDRSLEALDQAASA